ncbi:mitochondrial intermediate peptidase [Tanacetum coccineum]
MAESLIDLENVLRSKQGKLSSQEANFLMNWKESTLRQLTVGACAGGAIAWSATGSLSRMLRINLAGAADLFASMMEEIKARLVSITVKESNNISITSKADALYLDIEFPAKAVGQLGDALAVGLSAAAVAATWRFRSSVNSCIEQILCMDGSRMQKELANIMLKRYPNYPLTTKLISKRFYCENVFDDTTSDIPKSRWRFRNNFVESAAHPQQRTENHESSDHESKTGPERKPVPINNAFVAMENPFDCVFGLPTKVEEIRRPVPATLPRKHSRKHRRSQRRHQNHQQDEFDYFLFFPLHPGRNCYFDPVICKWIDLCYVFPVSSMSLAKECNQLETGQMRRMDETKNKDMGVFTDHYIILGLPSGKQGTKVSMDEIKQAYRMKALELHPDKRGDDPNAVVDFQQLQASYEILKDEKTRKAFDVDLIRRLKHQELEKERKQRRIQGRLNMARGIKRINRMHEASKG